MKGGYRPGGRQGRPAGLDSEGSADRAPCSKRSNGRSKGSLGSVEALVLVTRPGTLHPQHKPASTPRTGSRASAGQATHERPATIGLPARQHGKGPKTGPPGGVGGGRIFEIRGVARRNGPPPIIRLREKGGRSTRERPPLGGLVKKGEQVAPYASGTETFLHAPLTSE
jgi:hypothetical protein